MEEQKPKEDIVNLIKKCLALSSSPNEHEATLAMEKAQQLLLKYNLEMRDIDLKAEHFTPELVNLPVNFPSKLPNWKLLLIHQVAKNNFCKVVLAGTRIHILGRGFNVVAVMEMSVWVSGQVEVLAFTNTTVYPGRDKIRYRNSFLMGIVHRLGERLKELQTQEVAQDSNTKALVVDSRKALEDFAHTQFGHLRPTNMSSGSSTLGYNDGVRAGNDISLVRPANHVGTRLQIEGGY